MTMSKKQALQRAESILRVCLEGNSYKQAATLLNLGVKNVGKIMRRYYPHLQHRATGKIYPYRKTPLTARQKFWASVNVSEDTNICWEWTQKTSCEGYGRLYFTLSGKAEYAHHIAYLFSRGKRAQQWVLHKCGNRPCVNPHHLYDGTHTQNMQDKLRHARERGEPLHKTLDHQTILSIYKLSHGKVYSVKELARKFNTTGATVYNIKNRRSHASLTQQL